MIKIIKSGKKEFIATCSNCGCQFSYEVEDVIANHICCPECDSLITHQTTLPCTPSPVTDPYFPYVTFNATVK